MIYTVTFNPAIDYVVRLDRPLEVGEVNRAAGEDCVLGGKGINVSGVLRELGCESVALGFVAGETGAWLERGLAAQGLRTDFIHLAEGMTRINVKIKAGTETELNGAGPSIPESAMQQLEAQLDTLQPDDILILAGSIPKSLSQSTYERLLAGAGGPRRAGRGGCHPGSAGQRSPLSPLPDQAQRSRAGRDRGPGAENGRRDHRRCPRPAGKGCPERTGEHGRRRRSAGG